MNICVECKHHDKNGTGIQTQYWLCLHPKLDKADHVNPMSGCKTPMRTYCKEHNKLGTCQLYEAKA